MLLSVGDLSDAQVEALAGALSRNGFATSGDEIRRAVAGNEVKFQAFDDKTGRERKYHDKGGKEVKR